jgi:membrane protease YdiL (CAAX protease family)
MDTKVLRASSNPDRDEPAPVGWTLWETALVFIIWLVATVLIGMLVGGRLKDPFQDVMLLYAPPLLLGASTLLWVRARSKDGVRQLVGPERPNIRGVIAGLVYGVIGAVVFTFGIGLLLQALIEALGFKVPPVQQLLRELVTGAAAPLAIPVIVVIAPITEELFFRGMLFQAFERRLDAWRSAVLSAAVFAAVHIEWFVFVITFLFGVYLALIFRRRGTIVTPIIAHMLFNGLGVLLIRAGVG